MRTPFGDLDARHDGLSMAELHEVLVTRRRVLQGAAVGAAVAASPMLWVKPGHSAVPAAGTHLTYGADPATEAVVSWSTEGTVTGLALDLGTTASYGTVVPVESRGSAGTTTVYHHARLTRLLPGTTYHYRLRHDGGTTPDRTFATASTDPRKPFRFTAFGDQGVNANAAAGAARIVAEDPAFHVHAGDLCYANSGGMGGDGQPYDATLWDAWFAQNLAVGTKGVPWMPTVGNHEMEPGFGPQGYDGFLARFTLPRNGVAGALNTYWFRYGNVAVVALDGNDASHEIAFNKGWLGDRQDAWLTATLAALRADQRVDFIVVAFHNCMYCSNAVHASDGGVRSRWEAIFDEHAVDLVVNGHNHSYERTHPLRAGAVTETVASGGTVSPATQGTTYITAGGGGQAAYPANASPVSYVVEDGGVRVPELATWSAISTEDYNLLVADVVPLAESGMAEMRLRAVQPDGSLIDAVTLVRPARAALVGRTTEPVAAPAAPAPPVAAPAAPAPSSSGGVLASTGLGTGLAVAGAAALGAAALATRSGSEA